MKNLFLRMFLTITCLFIIIPAAPAQEISAGTSSGQEPKDRTKDAARDIIVVSKSEITESSAGKYLRHYINSDASLSRNINHELQARGLSSGPTRSIDDGKTREHQYVLTYRIDALEFGFKTPFGRHTRLKVSYAFQKKQGDTVISGEFEEHSKKGWKNCVTTISGKIAGDVSNALAGKFDAIRQQKKGKETPRNKDEKNLEVRLQQLDDLNAKGLVTPEEYQKKREEILRDL